VVLGLWADLRSPTVLFPCSPALVERAERMVACHAGELARNDYLGMLRATGRLAAIRGVERVLGFGATALAGVQHAELLTELGRVGGRWRAGIPRVSPRLDLPVAWGADVSDHIASVR